MEPFSLMALASAAGGGLNAIGKLLSGASQKTMSLAQAKSYDIQAQTYGLQADAAKANTDILNTQADTAGLGTEFAAAHQRQQLGQIMENGRQTLAAQRSYFAGNHLDPTFGSPLLTQAITAGRIASDVDLTGANFAVEKANVQSNVATLRGQAAGSASQALTALFNRGSAEVSRNAALAGGDAAVTASYLGAGTALLSGFSGMSGMGSGGGGYGGGMGIGSGSAAASTGRLY